MAWSVTFSKNFKEMLIAFDKAGKGLHEPKEMEFDFSPRTVWRKLRYWGLIDSPKQGHGQITTKGKEFLNGQISIPKKLEIENDAVVGQSQDLVTVNNF